MIAAAKNGAQLVLHHLGGPTANEMKEVEDKVKEAGGKVVVVEGDISETSTASLVSYLPALQALVLMSDCQDGCGHVRTY